MNPKLVSPEEYTTEQLPSGKSPKDLDVRYAMHTSDIRRFKECRQMWDFSSFYRMNRVPKREQPQLVRGRAWHRGLEMYHLDGSDPVAGFEIGLKEELDRAKKAGRPMDEDDVAEQREIARTVLPMYPKWAEENLKGFEIVTVEEANRVPMVGPFDFAWRADMIVRNDIGYWMVDFKTTVQMPSDPEYLDMDEQISGYLKASEIKYGHPFVGAIFIYIWARKPSVPKLLKSGALSRSSKLVTTAQTYYDVILEYGLDPRDYQEILAHYHHLPTRWFSRFDIIKSGLEKDITWQSHKEVVRLMLQDDLLIYRAPARITCDRCSYKHPCTALWAGRDISGILKNEYVAGEER